MKNIKDFPYGVDEVEITDELIKKLVEEKKWGDPKILKEFAEKGAKWNIKRNSLIMNI
jgi:hypothetical protein